MLPTGPSAERAALLVIPAVCTLATAPERDREKDCIDPGKLQSTHTHRGYTGLPLAPLLPPFLSLSPIPSVSHAVSLNSALSIIRTARVVGRLTIASQQATCR